MLFFMFHVLCHCVTANNEISLECKETLTFIQSSVMSADLEPIVKFAVDNDLDVSESHPMIDIVLKFCLAALTKHCGLSQNALV